MRMIAMGTAALAEGFALLGFETYPDADAARVEKVLEELVRGQHEALVILEQHLARNDGVFLKQVRNESGRIVVTEVPPLHAPADYRPPVEELVERSLGASALEDTP